jgi:hypothetical protein
MPCRCFGGILTPIANTLLVERKGTEIHWVLIAITYNHSLTLIRTTRKDNAR